LRGVESETGSGNDTDRARKGTAKSGCATPRPSGQTVEETAGAGEVWVALFFFAEFAGVRDKTAAGTARWMLDVKHLVEENVFDDAMRNGGTVHTAVQNDLIRAGVVATELAAPVPHAPTDVRAREFAFKVEPV
jgi:hypothetical protein